ncbi:MAG TPA: GH92 family glycosyl hydrolase [Verrucomicrobiae bacterium]|nr:GH92 family glycosyl hydrolase [Verrucomicrobiae bacterium]
MKHRIYQIAGLCVILSLTTGAWAKSPMEYVNCLVGTAPLDNPQLLGNAPPPGEEAYTGFTTPGAALPHGVTVLSPVNKDLSTASGNHGIIYPYTYPRKTMVGFSLNTMPGMLLMPLVGDWTVPPDRAIYASAYDKASEKATPGYYSVWFPDHRIKSELTASRWTGVCRFTFPKTGRATILVDFGAGESEVEIVGDHEIRGHNSRFGRFGGGGGRGRTNCFVAIFSKPFHFGTFGQGASINNGVVRWSDGVSPNSRTRTGNYAGCYLNFATSEGEQVLVKMTTGESYEKAQKKLAAECPEWDFDGIKRAAERAWTEKINSIEIDGGTEKEKTLFYSCLYHAFASPRLVTKAGEEYSVRGGGTQVAESDRYSEVPFWDTGRNQVVLLTLLEPKVKLDILRSQLDRAKETGWMATSFHGDHAVLMYLGDWNSGLQFDWAGVYQYLRNNAVDPDGPRPRLAEYIKQGWIHDVVVDHPSPPYADGNAGVAKTLEYSWDDYAMAMFARKLGKEDDYRMFLARAHNYTNVFDPSTGFMRGRKFDGSWIEPFHPEEPYYNFMYKEASAWQTTWLVPHDVAGLIALMGGREKFVARLDDFFTKPYHPTGIARDVTGMLGQYCAGNQPDIQTAYYHDYAGQPWKTQETVRKLLRLMFGSDKADLAFPGMDDQGSMASWYVLSGLGFYPVDPGSGNCVIGSPLFKKATIHLGNGKTFEIIARHNSEKDVYIQSATLNGKPLDRPWFRNSDMTNGGRLELEMGSSPNKQWGAAEDAAPPSMSDHTATKLAGTRPTGN